MLRCALEGADHPGVATNAPPVALAQYPANVELHKEGGPYGTVSTSHQARNGACARVHEG